jgi:hypothetical protein
LPGTRVPIALFVVGRALTQQRLAGELRRRPRDLFDRDGVASETIDDRRVLRLRVGRGECHPECESAMHVSDPAIHRV